MENINDKSYKILYLLFDSAVRLKNGLLLEEKSKEFLQSRPKEMTLSTKINYLSQVYLSSENFISGSTSLMRALFELDGKEYNNENLYEMWKKLSEEEKYRISDDTFRKYRELYEIRMGERKKDFKPSPSFEIMNEKNIDTKLRLNTEYLSSKKVGKESLPDMDFLSKFSIGLARYYMGDYFYKGRLSDVQKLKAGYDAFDGLKSIVENDDEKFRQLSYRQYSDAYESKM